MAISKTVYLNGHIDVPDDRIDAIKVAVVEHIALTRAEAGCISFEVTPCDAVHGRFLVSEAFVDQAAFDAHQLRAKASPWAIVTNGIPRDYKITVGSR